MCQIAFIIRLAGGGSRVYVCATYNRECAAHTKYTLVRVCNTSVNYTNKLQERLKVVSLMRDELAWYRPCLLYTSAHQVTTDFFYIQ